MRASLIRTASGSSFTADIVPADVVDRCEPCGRVFREGDWFCNDLAAQRGHTIARLAVPSLPSAAAAPRPAVDAFTPVFLAPRT